MRKLLIGLNLSYVVVCIVVLCPVFVSNAGDFPVIQTKRVVTTFGHLDPETMKIETDSTLTEVWYREGKGWKGIHSKYIKPCTRGYIWFNDDCDSVLVEPFDWREYDLDGSIIDSVVPNHKERMKY